MADISENIENPSPSSKRRRLNEPGSGTRFSCASPSAGDSASRQRGHYYSSTSLCDNSSAQFGDIHHSHFYASPHPSESIFDLLSKSLRFERMDARLNNVQRASTRTCTWLFDKKDFVSWLDNTHMHDHHGFLWIKGKPGSGKSTIMKLAYQQARKARSRRTILSYFFNARAPGDLEKSSLGFYRSIVHQLLKAVPALRDNFLEHFRTKERDGIVESWTSGELQEFIFDTIADSVGLEVQLFIDALDEGDEEDVRQMVVFLERLAQSGLESQRNIRICLSSRHYPHISIAHGLELVVEDQIEHGQDIQYYISDELRGDQGEELQNLKGELLRKAAGIFLWIRIVVQILNTTYDKGVGMRAVAKHLQAIPSGLDSLFEDILVKNLEDIENCVVLLQWVLCSTRALNPQELHEMIKRTHNKTSDVEESISFEPKSTELFLLNCSRGLVELTNSEPPTVQFIHETVRSFLLSEKGLARIDPQLAGKVLGMSHNRLKETCLGLIRRVNFPCFETGIKEIDSNMSQRGITKAVTEKLRSDLKRDHPNLCYAVDNLLYHADVAQAHGCCQSTFLQCFAEGYERKIAEWRLLHNCLARYANQSYSMKVSIWYIVADQNLLSLARCLFENFQYDVNDLGERYGTPLQVACVNGHLDMVALLLGYAANVNLEGGELKHPLKAALHKQQWQITALLRDHGAKLSLKLAAEVLYNACQQGKGQTVQFLLGMGISANAALSFDIHCQCDVTRADYMIKPRTCGNITPLCVVARRGNIGIARMLLNSGAEINKSDCRGTSLYHALLSGELEFFNAMVESGADLRIHTVGSDPLLTVAAFKGFLDVVKRLVQAGVDINIIHGCFGTALHAAVEFGHLEIVQYLLAHGANLNAEGGHWTTVLHAASASGSEEILHLLLDKGADINAVNGCHGSEISAAVFYSRLNIIQALVRRGADVNLATNDYGCPLALAQKIGHQDIIDFLIANGAQLPG